jgi:dihydropteroate synthase
LVLNELAARTQAALAAGICRDSIVVDPGFGFGKAFDENYPLLAHLDQLRVLGFPILAGISRKSFLSRTAASASRPATVPSNPRFDSEIWDPSRQLPTAVANTAAILAGAHILRVHDVRPALQAAAIADRILKAAQF